MNCSSSIYYVHMSNPHPRPLQTHLREPGAGEHRSVCLLKPAESGGDVSGVTLSSAQRASCLQQLTVAPPLCLFQNHRNVKTPESHSSRCLQQHREPAVSVSCRLKRKEREKLRSAFCIYLCFSKSPKWVRVTGLAQTDPP